MKQGKQDLNGPNPAEPNPALPCAGEVIGESAHSLFPSAAVPHLDGIITARELRARYRLTKADLQHMTAVGLPMAKLGRQLCTTERRLAEWFYEQLPAPPVLKIYDPIEDLIMARVRVGVTRYISAVEHGRFPRTT